MALTEIELAEKAKAGTLTVGEAIDFGEANAKKLHPNVKSYGPSMSTLRGHLELLGISPDTLYKDMQGEASKFTVEGTPEFDSKGRELKPANRITPLQHLESILRKGEQTPFEKYGVIGTLDPETNAKMYPQLVGAKTAAGGQRTGLAQTRQMRGVLPKADFVQMYDIALPNIVKSHGQAVADIMAYHAATFNRPEQLLGLKKDDVFVSGDEITVRGKKAIDNKGRPELTFKLDSPMGQLLKRNFDSASEFLFDVTEPEMDEAFARHISPQLEKYSNILPVIEEKGRDTAGKVVRTESPVLTKSVVRHIAPTYLIDELGVDERLVEVMMGHKQASTLRKHYAGIRPNSDLPKILENPEDFARLGFDQNPKTVNLDLLSEADKKKIAEEQTKTLISETQRDRKQADAATAEAEAAEVKARASITPAEIEAAKQVDEKLIEANELKRIQENAIKQATREKVKAKKAEENAITSTDDLPDSLKKKMAKFGIRLGAGLVSALGTGIAGALTVGTGLKTTPASASIPTEDEAGFEDLPRSTPLEALTAGAEVAEGMFSPLPMTGREMYEKRDEIEQLDTDSGLRMSMPETQESNSFLNMQP